MSKRLIPMKSDSASISKAAKRQNEKLSRRDFVWNEREKRGFAALPEGWSVGDVPWQLLAHLTFRRTDVPHSLGLKICFAWIRELADLQGAYFPRVLILLKRELGRSGQHAHYHALIGGLRSLPQNFCSRALEAWKAKGGGIDKIALFDDSLDGVGYALKLGRGYGQSKEARSDEIEIPTLSRAVFRYLRRRAQ